MTTIDRIMPEIMQQLHQIEVDYADGEGIDLEPFPEFMSEVETTEWIRLWTGNHTIDGAEYRVFAQDGSGGYVAIWCVCANADLLEQPIVFFGSEGDLGVVASNFNDYLWLLADGIGALEAIVFGSTEPRSSQPEFMNFAQKYATSPRENPQEIIKRANAKFPNFASNICALCR